MIGYLSGKIVAHTYDSVIISVRGVGYEINFLNNLTLSDFGNKMSLFISHKISEYGQALYGFNTFEERQLFEVLTSIKGVGAKAIFRIMSELEIKSISKIREVKIDDLVKVDGVGKSIAQKFLLGLSNKLKKELSVEELINPDSDSQLSLEYEDIFRTLAEWGIARKDMNRIISIHKAELENKSQEYVVRFILKQINQR